MYVIIFDMLWLDVEVEWFKTITKDHHIPGISEDILLPAMHLEIKQLIAIEGT